MKQSTQQLSAPRKRPFSRTPLNRTWFQGHGYTKSPEGILPRTYYVKVTDEHQEGIICDVNGKKRVPSLQPSKKRCKKKSLIQYYYITFKNKGKVRSFPMHYLIFCTFNHIPTKGNHIDHINGNHFDNRPSNLREVKPAINRRDGGFCKLSRNRGIDPKQFPTPVWLQYFEILAEFKACHSKWKYRNLTKDDLLGFLAQAATRVSLTKEFYITDPHDLSDREISRHCEF